MTSVTPKRHLPYSPAFRAQLAERKQWAAMSRDRLRLLDRRDSLATLIDARTVQLNRHIEEFEAIEGQLAQLEERST